MVAPVQGSSAIHGTGSVSRIFVNDVFGGDVLGLGLVGDGHAVAQHVEPMLFTSCGVT